MNSMCIKACRYIFFLLLLIIIIPQAVSQEESTLEWYYEQASEAIAKEYYESATRYIEEGKKVPRFFQVEFASG